uniref:hypothetical protein n=1 Tax=Hyunsoonleella ulvae TaxID=2799948 RepID=UPI00374353B9
MITLSSAYGMETQLLIAFDLKCISKETLNSASSALVEINFKILKPKRSNNV